MKKEFDSIIIDKYPQFGMLDENGIIIDYDFKELAIYLQGIIDGMLKVAPDLVQFRLWLEMQ